MSNFKIIGPSNPEIGKEIIYKTSISNLPISLPGQINPVGNNPFVEQVKWSIYILEYGKWILKEKNNKTGPTANYTFTEVSLKRQAIRIVALFGNEKATLDIKPLDTIKRKIVKVELCDALGNLQTKPFAYNQTVLARVHCLNLDNCAVHVTLWEDDAPGAGHNEINKNNKAITKSEMVSNGIADVKFKLAPDFAKMADAHLAKGDKSEGKTHEYYVTAEIFRQETKSSNNINVINPNNKTADTKATPQKPAADKPVKPKPKPTAPAAKKGPSKKEEKGILESVGGSIYDWGESGFKAIASILPDPMEIINSVAKLGAGDKKDERDGTSCGEKYCIKKGDKSELIREVNIRLAGFGGNVPTDEFTDRTEKMIKQFQRDYMKVPETGKVCGNVLKAMDRFQNEFSIDFTEAKCKCGKCVGFGDGSNKGKYLEKSVEAYHKYEYPGIHRSLLSSLRSVKFYLKKDGRYSFNKINSGYRCRFHPEYLKKPTTNHMGKALDLHFNDKNGRTRENSDMETIRKDIFNKYLGAKWDWKTKDIFNLESTAVGALTWVHYDVREFNSVYLEDKFFVKNITNLNGKSIVALALELGFGNTCSCLVGATNNTNGKETIKKNNKYKWAHSEFGNLIAMKESSDNYNICNKTKGGYQVINNVKVIDLTIEEIQKKQKNRDLFAVGRYQLVPETLNDAVEKLALDISKKLDEEMQDEIFDEYLIKIKRPKIIAYLESNGSIEDAMYVSAMEWASIGVQKGKRISDKVEKKDGKITKTIRYAEGGESYYAGDGLNKAHITPEQIKNALTTSKNENNK